MVTSQNSNSVVRDCFPRGENMDLFFNPDIENLLLKINLGRGRRPNFVIFVVWSALIVGGWVMVPCSKKYCLGSAEILSFVFLVYNSGMGDAG